MATLVEPAPGRVAAGAPPVIEVAGLEKSYVVGDVTVHALRGVDLAMPTGAFTAVVGASGSGKSTFMNILGLLDRPTRGRYLLAGDDVSQLDGDRRARLRNRKIGFVFQSFNLLPRTSALENVELPMLYASRTTAEDRHRQALSLLSAVGLGERAHHTPNQLSGGQQQRVAIARSLVNDPEVLLADEPTGNLDSRTSLEVMQILQRVNRERGVTVVLITHEPDIAAYADRVIAFRDGRVVSDAPVPERRDAAVELAALPPPEE
jgi:putative ABC transport system ATP-binding protein